MIKKLAIAFLLIFNIQAFWANNIVLASNFNPNFTPTTKAISLINLDTDTQVYAKNPDEKMYPASTTKIMTYIVVVEHISDLENTMVTVHEKVLKILEGTGSSLAEIKDGDVLSIKQLLYCMMVPSGNDAAVVLADFVGNGNIQSFVDMMNEKAKALGCDSTHFANPDGLHDPLHYTTANDLAKIAQYALTLPDFIDITSTTSYTLSEDRNSLITTNFMINKNAESGYYYYQYAKGIKTGHTDEAGYCLVSTASADGYTYLCVALGAPSMDQNGNDIKENNAMLDSRQLYRWALTSLDIKPLVSVEEPLGEVKIGLSLKKDSILLFPEKRVSTVLPKNISPSSLEIKVEKPEFINAPILKGQKIGTAIFNYANQEITRIDLVANENVNKSFVLSFFNTCYKIISSKVFIISAITFIALVIIYVIMIFTYRKKSLARRNNRRD